MKSKLKKAPLFLRVCARAIDYSVFFLFETVILAFLPFYFSDLFYLYAAFITPLLWIPLEAYLISTWGETPGNAMCGIVIRTGKGDKANYKSALMKGCFLKRSEAYSFSKDMMFRLTQWVMVVGTVVACWGSSILGVPLISQYTNVYKSFVSISGWMDYQDFNKGFSILFPSYPESNSENFDNPHTRDVLTYNELKSCENDKVCYTVGYLDLPRSWRFAGAKTLLKGALEIVVEHEKNADLVSSQLTRHQRNPAIDFEINKGKTVEKGKLVLIGRTLYRLMVTQPQSYPDSNLQPFIDSFQLRWS